MTKLIQLFLSVGLRRWLIVSAVASAVSAGAWTVRWHYAEVRQGKQDTRDSMALAASRIAPEQRAAVTITKWRTDTQWLRAKASIARVDTFVLRVPDSVRAAFPVVDSALRQCTTLARDCEKFRADVLTERIARDSLQVTSDMIVVTVRDSLHVEQDKPKRTIKSNTFIATLGAAAGAVLTFFLQR